MSEMLANVSATQSKDRTSLIKNEVRGVVLWGAIVVLATFGGFGGWALTAQLAGAVVAEGTVKVLTSRKSVQTLEGGVVEQILVKNGEQVKQGQILVVLNKTQAEASYSINQLQYDTTRAAVARLRAEREGLAEIEFPEDLIRLANAGNTEVQELMDGQMTLKQARQESLDGQAILIHERIAQLENEIVGIEAQKTAKSTQKSLLVEERDGLDELFEQGYVAKTRILALDREIARYEGEIGEHLSSISQSKQQISESELEIAQLQREFHEQVVTELRSQEDSALDMFERTNSAAYSLQHNEIRATENGTVMGMQVHTVGAVLSPSTTLLEIVPESDGLIVEARINPVDVDNTVQGLDADIQFTAFSQRKTPKLTGTVSYVAGDSDVDPVTGLPSYTVQVLSLIHI